MKNVTKIALISVMAVVAVLSGMLAAAFFGDAGIGRLDPEITDWYGWEETEVASVRNTGVGYAVSTYMPDDGRPGNLKVMTYSYPFPSWIAGDVTRDLAMETALRNAKSYDMVFTSTVRGNERMNGEDGEVIYIDFVTTTPLKPIIGLNMSAHSHGRFIIALFSPAGGMRDQFVLVVAYTLTGHDIYLRDRRIYSTPEDLGTYDEMKDLIFNHIALVEA